LVTCEVPELRIVDDDLWEAVKAKQAELQEKHAKVISRVRAYHAARANALNVTHRPRYLLSGKLLRGLCGGPYSIRGQERFACSNRVMSNSCSNKHSVSRKVIEARVLAGLCGPLLDPKLADAAIRAYINETQRLNRLWVSSHDGDRKMLTDIKKKLREISSAIEDGGYSRALSGRLRELEAQEDEIEERLSHSPLESPSIRTSPIYSAAKSNASRTPCNILRNPTRLWQRSVA